MPADHSSYEGRAQQSLTTAWPPAALISSAMTLSVFTFSVSSSGYHIIQGVSSDVSEEDGGGGECGEGAEQNGQSESQRFLPTSVEHFQKLNKLRTKRRSRVTLAARGTVRGDDEVQVRKTWWR